MRIKKLVTACLLASSAQIVISPAFAYTSPSCSSDTCYLQSIDNNTGTDSETTTGISDYLTERLDFGTYNFGNNGISPGTSTYNTDINSKLITQNFWATDSLVRNLIVPLLSNTQNYPRILLASQSTGSSTDQTWADAINNIQKDRIDTILGDYFTATANTGNNPIQMYDIAPYAYPPSNQLIKTSLNSVSPVQFLYTLKQLEGTSNSEIPSMLANYQYCPNIFNSVGNQTNGTTASSSNASICFQPIEQMNIVSGIGDGNNNTGNVTANLNYDTDVPQYFTFLYQTASPEVLPSLSIDTLLSPLSYETSAVSETDGSSSVTVNGSLNASGSLGLHGQNQLAMAENFVRYVSGEVMPNNISSSSTYNSYYQVATSDTACFRYRLDAAMKIKAYRSLLRSYAAQVSVGTSNLYYLMEKRKVRAGSGSSQLEEEFKMATYRIFNPEADSANSSNTSTTTDWETRLQNASSAEIQRQIAKLLAEINYQLFLNRRDQERMLVTLSAMQLDANSQKKKQLTIDEASTYISQIQTPSLDPSTSSCTQSGDDMN